MTIKLPDADPTRAVAAVKAIYKLLYREISPKGDEFLNLNKEVNGGDFVDEVTSLVACVMPYPPEAKPCDECGASIPETPGGHLENKWHDDSCSLYDATKE